MKILFILLKLYDSYSIQRELVEGSREAETGSKRLLWYVQVFFFFFFLTPSPFFDAQKAWCVWEYMMM